ncbi:ribokinase [Halioglobus sp. Uisw_031]|uniref:ribokinase n=1 Tax=Halioglobus sp. Uisw_031 TaxID=3230977 RepID=UPI0039E7310F
MKSKIINFGSINIDHVYRVPHLVKPGETLSSLDLVTGLGGKGANQSVAIARAGVSVAHVGRVFKGDRWAVELLASTGVDTDNIALIEGASGHAIIQVDDQGENAIVLHGGANQSFSIADIESALNHNQQARYLLMQNETNLLAEAFELAQEKGIKIVLNPAPMTDNIKDLPLAKLDTLIVNRGEAEALCGAADIDQMTQQMAALAPQTRVVVTLGGDGAMLLANGEVTHMNSPSVDVVDTTGAGDTFVGYFLAGVAEGMNDHDALQRACLAGSIAVTRQGAIKAIPDRSEVNR